MRQNAETMKILHTSDWHIGKKLEGRSRLDEQRKVLSEIVDICDGEGVQLVIISGDVYDAYTPPAEAEELFFETLSKLTAGKRIAIIISGNHDDSVRLFASSSLSHISDVYFADDKFLDYSKACVSSGIKMEERGEGYFVVGADGESVYIGTLSYPTELRLKEKVNDDESYADKVARWIKKCFENNVKRLPEILVSHLFMLGGERSEGERNIELGGARIIDKSAIPDEVIYTALGHLHKRQVVDGARHVIYSGSPMPYHFDEAGVEKSVTIFEIHNDKVENLRTRKITSALPLNRATAHSLEEARKICAALSGYTELTLTLDKPLESSEHKAFCLEFPDVFLKLKFNGGTEFSTERRELSNEDLFKEYYKTRFGSDAPQEMVELFLSFVHEIEVNDETD